MFRLCGLLILSFVVSILCFVAIKGLVVVMALLVYGGHYSWGVEDVRFVLIRGACLGVVFSVYVVIQYISARK
jgi:hypothetical protein